MKFVFAGLSLLYMGLFVVTPTSVSKPIGELIGCDGCKQDIRSELRYSQESKIYGTKRLRNGTILHSTEWGFDSLVGESLRGFTSFYPSTECTSIRYIQIARVRVENQDYQWPFLESARNSVATSCSGTVYGGFYVDHQATSCAEGSTCSPYLRDHWENSEESQDGWHYGKTKRPATFVDYPFGWSVIDEVILENCAVCATTDKILGCVRWGAVWDQNGKTLVKPEFSEDSSNTFKQALGNFTRFYGNQPPKG